MPITALGSPDLPQHSPPKAAVAARSAHGKAVKASQCEARSGSMREAVCCDIARKNSHVRTAQGCEEGAKPGRSGFLLNAGAHWLINESWSAGAFYHLETRSHEVSQEASLSVQCAF